MLKMKIINADAFNYLPNICDSAYDVVFTDPPFVHQKFKSLTKIKQRFGKVTADTKAAKVSLKFDVNWLVRECIRVSKLKVAAFFGNEPQLRSYFNAAKALKLKWKLIWVCKTQPNFWMSKYCKVAPAEYVVLIYKDRLPGVSHNNNFYKINNAIDRAGGHPTRKTVSELLIILRIVVPPKRPIKVLDPFAGSGSVLVACKRLGIDCDGIEISPHWCEVANQRIKNPCQPVLI